jgi:hypothetical protein
MSTAERKARANIALPDTDLVVFDAELVRGLLADIAVWRDLATHDRDKWSFDALVYIGERLLAEVYPEKIFTGESGDSGPQYVVTLREALRRVAVDDSGTRITWDAAGKRIVTPL